MPDPVRITDSTGTVYRVFDGAMRSGKLIVADPPAAWATSRVFRPQTGHRRLYRIRDGADRRTDEATLRRQLAAAEYLPTSEPGPRNVDPR